jgi:hypothetical protein
VGTRVREYWRSLVEHPIVRLELRRVRRKRWWPRRRFFLFYPALLGAALGCVVVVALGDVGDRLPVYLDFLDPAGSRVAALVAAVPSVCLANALAWLLAAILPWIVPALTAPAIARERELGTLDLLRVTLLGERSIVLGKLGACLLRLWPGLLALALLAPFQVVWVAGARLITVTDPTALLVTPQLDLKWSWILLLAVYSSLGLIKPWSDLAFHAAIGLFVSVVARSSGVAVAVAYASVIVARFSLWLGLMLVSSMGVLWSDLSESALPGLDWVSLALEVVGPLLVEAVGAALLIWAAIWWLKRA